MKPQGSNIQMSASSMELPQVKSSKELLRKMQIKHGKMTSNQCGTIRPRIATETQLNLPTFKLHNHANLDRRLSSRNENGKLKKKTANVVDKSKEKLLQIERAFTQGINSNDNSKSKEGLVIEDVESMTRQCVAPKDTKTKLGSMSIDQFLKENGSIDDEEENIENGSEEAEEYVGEGNISQDKDVELNEKEGTKKKRTRGPTQCLAIHGRSMQDRPKVVLDADGEPIGPTDKIVTGEKFNISDKGEKVVFTRINDAWRRYKSFIKKKQFSKYSTLKDRLKHRPLFLSEAHFKQLLKYWNTSTIQSISERNVANRAKQKYIHRMGPTSFAKIHAELRTKKEVGEKVTQAKMFITTRQRREGRKGKELDEETHNAIEKFNISDKGEKVVFTRINDAWRRYKSFIKKKQFSKYSTLKDRLKHRPLFLSEAHFKQLLKYWNTSTIQSISERNVANRAKQKYIHRMGPTSFAKIHAELRTKKEVGEKVTQAKMFITTRQRREGRKGKELDEETHNAIIKLQGSIQNASDYVEQTFKSLFGKEKPGRLEDNEGYKDYEDNLIE
ncbi:putative transposase [Vigna unguiculata]|uniref:Putative transposase n=1 Tax=Vigna unguiculata TaxID=3917 RepID=A0A4D6NFR5_VIGUN|nr:putative transposase [Vigna unguiculata]